MGSGVLLGAGEGEGVCVAAGDGGGGQVGSEVAVASWVTGAIAVTETASGGWLTVAGVGVCKTAVPAVCPQAVPRHASSKANVMTQSEDFLNRVTLRVARRRFIRQLVFRKRQPLFL